MDIKIHIKREAYKFLRYWVDNDDKEIAGYCEASFDKTKKVITVSKAHIVKMLSNSGANVKLDNEDHFRLMTQLPDNAELRCHWHSHVNMGVSPSGTDDSTNIENAEHGWFCSIILNKQGSISGQIAFPAKSELGDRVIYYNNITVTVESELSGDELDFAADELKRVQPPKPVTSTSHYLSGDYWKDKEWNPSTHTWDEKPKVQGQLFDTKSPLLTSLQNVRHERSEADLMEKHYQNQGLIDNYPDVADWGWLGLGLEQEAKMLAMSPRKYRSIISNPKHKKFESVCQQIEALYDQQLGNK